MKKTATLLHMLLTVSLVAGCSEPGTTVADKQTESKNSVQEQHEFTFQVQPETFDLQIEQDGVKHRVSEPLTKQTVVDFTKTDTSAAWTYPDQQVKVEVAKRDGGLYIQITSTGTEAYTWPVVQSDSYILPLGEGKYIPSNDPHWQTFLNNQSLTFSESFSMRFFAANQKNRSLLFIADDIYNNRVNFSVKPSIGFSFTHEFPSLNPKNTYGFTIYATQNDPVTIAKLYKEMIVKNGELVTLQEKARSNPNIEKLYGAPHIYLWNKDFISDTNIRWPLLGKQLNESFVGWLLVLAKNETEDGTEAIKVLGELKRQDYADKYQKRVITKLFNELLQVPTFYNPAVFPDADAATRQIVQKGTQKLTETELYQVNKQLLKSVLKDATDDVAMWGADKSVKLLKEMQAAGIGHAWIGLPDWTEGFINPALVKQANEIGYLIGPYDSYHSIHQTKNKDWQTAYFPEGDLYENATITNKNGKKIAGFLQQGRKLNPTLSRASVQNRVNGILDNGVAYNSWFIDCDATGEIYDDYTPGHITTQEQDMKARLQRMAYIANDKKMVVGSEGGNDYASKTIAFAHGLETPVIAWGDPDMRENKQSPYFTGAYWSADGGVPAKFGKQVPVKELYQHIYLDPSYNLPLFKLVYNDSVITTHHWEWGSLKVKGQTENRLLSEVLYNVPPLYHLDKNVWETDKETIIRQLQIWAPLHRKAVTQEMTDFQVLSQDRLVQMTRFGKDLRVIANFSANDFSYQGKVIKSKSLLIFDGKQEKSYHM